MTSIKLVDTETYRSDKVLTWVTSGPCTDMKGILYINIDPPALSYILPWEDSEKLPTDV